MQRGISWDLVRLSYPKGSWKGIIPFAQLPPTDFPSPFHRNVLNNCAQTLERRLRQVSPKPAFLELIRHQTYFERGFEDWVITDAVRAHKLTGFDIFYALARQNLCSVWCDYQYFTEAEYRRIYDQQTVKYFHYVVGISIHNRFPEDPSQEETRINRTRYEGGDDITRLGTLFLSRLKDTTPPLPLPCTGC